MPLSRYRVPSTVRGSASSSAPGSAAAWPYGSSGSAAGTPAAVSAVRLSSPHVRASGVAVVTAGRKPPDTGRQRDDSQGDDSQGGSIDQHPSHAGTSVRCVVSGSKPSDSVRHLRPPRHEAATRRMTLTGHRLVICISVSPIFRASRSPPTESARGRCCGRSGCPRPHAGCDLHLARAPQG